MGFLKLAFLLLTILKIEMRVLKDAESKVYERKVFGILEVTGMIGGLFEVFERAGGFLVVLFSGKIFLYEILSKLYHVSNPQREGTQSVNF